MASSLPRGGVGVLGIFKLNFVANTEMAFSIPINQIVLIGIALIVLLGLIQYFTICVRDGLYGNIWALNFIIWGAFSNLYDRLSRGFVVDYIDFALWPVFNLSDLAIVVGLISLIILIARQERAAAYTLPETA